MSDDGASDYLLVARYLRGLQCPICGGVGGRVDRSGKARPCHECGGTGFKGGDAHLLVSASQKRRARR